VLPFVVSAFSRAEDILFAPSRPSLCPVEVVQKVQTKNTDILLNGSNSKNKAENIQKIYLFFKILCISIVFVVFPPRPQVSLEEKIPAANPWCPPTDRLRTAAWRPLWARPAATTWLLFPTGAPNPRFTDESPK